MVFRIAVYHENGMIIQRLVLGEEGLFYAVDRRISPYDNYFQIILCL